jgi:tetratricopeptide (TPR) repeat protein
MTSEIATTTNNALALPHWRDPQGVPLEVRRNNVAALERACLENPNSPDLQACLAMAHAVNFDSYKSINALETALQLDPNHYFAQLKLGEIWWRLRALTPAEEATIKALNLAKNQDEYQVARAQLKTIRAQVQNSAMRPTWGSKSLLTPALMVLGIAVVLGTVSRWM